jgi:glycosyltransferase involved in cell wall biosynthesis
MPSQPYLSVIVPAYNEKNNLKRPILKEVVNYLKQQNYLWELILSDDGSTDGTLTEFEKFAQQHQQVKVIANPHRGKGPTVSQGVLAATGQWRLFTDFDQSTPLKEVEKLLAYNKNYDVIIGSREISGAIRDKEPFHRHLMGRVFNLIVQLLAVPGIKDTQCGFKLFSQHATEILFPMLHVYSGDQVQKDAFTGAFDVELLFLANKYGFKTKEVPILWKHYHTDRVNPIKDSWRMFKDIIKIRIAEIQQRYSLTKNQD